LNEFCYFVADIFAVSVQYGHHTELCETINGRNAEENIPYLKTIVDKFKINIKDYDSNLIK